MDTNALSSVSSTPAVEPVAVPSAAAQAAVRAATVPAVQAVDQAASPANRQTNAQDRMQAVAQQLRDYLSSVGRDLEFRVDADTRQMVITVRESDTGAVIRQIPSPEALQMRRYLDEWSGTFLDTKT
jgi:flagellar protein FlaG